MKDSHILSDSAKEPVFIFQIVAAAALVAWPFLAMLLGFTLGSLVTGGAVYAADRYLDASRKKRAQEIHAASISYQQYVAGCAKRFFFVRIISVAVVACFLKHPAGLIYLLFCGAVSTVEIMWESSNLSDMVREEPIQSPQTTTGSSAPDRV